MKKLNVKGFGSVEALLFVVVVGLIAGIGAYVYNSQKKTNQILDRTAQSASQPQEIMAKTTAGSTNKTYDAAITNSIQDFNKASDSLKVALLNVYYKDAKAECDKQNANLPQDEQIKFVMRVDTMVRDDFAAVQFCGSGGTSIMVHTSGAWKVVGSLAMAPACTLVDQYKISKEITPACFTDDKGNSRSVTYP